MPEDGKRYEAIGGELYVTPAPSFRHQRVSGKLFTALVDLLEAPGLGYVLAAPVGVELWDFEAAAARAIRYVDRLPPVSGRPAPGPDCAERDLHAGPVNSGSAERGEARPEAGGSDLTMRVRAL